jgi:hypothetical protein
MFSNIPVRVVRRVQGVTPKTRDSLMYSGVYYVIKAWREESKRFKNFMVCKYLLANPVMYKDVQDPATVVDLYDDLVGMGYIDLDKVEEVNFNDIE